MINFLKVAVEIFFQVIEWAIILQVLLSWVVRDKDNYLVKLVSAITEPFVSPFRKIQDRFFPDFMLDFSPMIAIIILWIIESIVGRMMDVL